MKARRLPTLLVLLGFSAKLVAAPSIHWVAPDLPPPPANGPALCPGAYLTPAQGRAALDAALAQFPDAASWQAYAAHARERIRQGAGLVPQPRRTPLNAIIRARRDYDGYSVENVAFESVPGYFVTGNLFRPLNAQPPHAAILATHGHTNKIVKPEDYAAHGRFRPLTQALCASLARMGAVVLTIDMVGHGDSILQVDQDAHRRPFMLTLQAWNAMRAVDFLVALPGVDAKRIAVTGFSMGGTGAWHFAEKYPERFSAVIPVAGRPPESASAWRVPVLAIHSQADQISPFGPTEARIAELQQSGVHAKLIALNGITHFETNRFTAGLRQAIPWLQEVWK